MTIIANDPNRGNNLQSIDFNGNTLTTINQDNQIWLTSKELAKALGYADNRSVSSIYNKYSDEFTNKMTEVVESTTSSKAKGLKTKTRIFSLRGCHLLAMFARTEVAKDFRIWALDILDKEVGAPVVQTEELPSTVKDRNGLVKSARMAQKRMGIGYDEVFNLVHHRFNIDRIGELTVNQVGEATEYVQRMTLNVIADPYREPKVEQDYHYRNNDRLVSQVDAQGHLWTRPLADHEFIASTTSLSQFINDCNDFDLQQLTALSFAVSKKMMEAQPWSNVIMVSNTGEQL